MYIIFIWVLTMYIYNSESALTLVSKIETLSMYILLDKE